MHYHHGKRPELELEKVVWRREKIQLGKGSFILLLAGWEKMKFHE